jgi:hypothetical protein
VSGGEATTRQVSGRGAATTARLSVKGVTTLVGEQLCCLCGICVATANWAPRMGMLKTSRWPESFSVRLWSR